MDHKLSPELEELRRTVEEFAHDVVAPKIGDFYERHEFPYEIVREMGRMGLFGLPFPEEYGGMGGDYFALGVRRLGTLQPADITEATWKKLPAVKAGQVMAVPRTDPVLRQVRPQIEALAEAIEKAKKVS
ncbi:hypothetical protein SHIRM173S_11721 [Streptomyces hirsutus]